MLRQTLPVFALAAVLAAGVAHADHNSPFGEGWANMPNDAHDDAVDRVTDELRSDMAADGSEMRADMAAQVEDFEDIRSGMTDDLRGAMEDASEARAEMSEMAEDMRGAGMGR